MAKSRVRKFSEIFELETFLNGGIIAGEIRGAQGGGTPAALGVGIYGLVGKTLIFTSPSAVTVTFVASDGAGGSAEPGVGTNPDPQVLLFKDIKLQVEAAIAAVSVQSYKNRLVLIEATPTSGVALDNTGTASALLGLDNAGATTGLVYAPPPSATPPAWTWAYVDGSNSHVVYTLED